MKPLFALLKKEFSEEFRSKSGLLTAGMFGLVIVVSLSLAGFGKTISPALASSLVWVGMLFVSAIALPRTVIAEEERQTGDLLRLWTTPQTVFWAKVLFNLLLMATLGAFLAVVYLALVGAVVFHPIQFGSALIGGCAALSGTVTLCGALVAQTSQRGILAGAIALPLLIPLVFLGVAAMQATLVQSGIPDALTIAGLWCYAIASHAIGPILFEHVWKP